MDKQDVVYIYTHIHNGILLSHKKNETMPSAPTWMDIEMIILSEVNQKGKGKYYITYVWALKEKDTNELISKTEDTHRHRKENWLFGYQRGKRSGRRDKLGG